MEKIVTKNKKASFNYFIEEKFEAGIVLSGSEVKSIRLGKVNIEDSYADQTGNELFLFNSYIGEYKEANRFNHIPRQPRKLLLHKREIKKIIGIIKQKGYTIVPLSLYFNDKNKAKLTLAIVKGKQNYDRRQTIKEKDWQRDQGRMMKNIMKKIPSNK